MSAFVNGQDCSSEELDDAFRSVAEQVLRDRKTSVLAVGRGFLLLARLTEGVLRGPASAPTVPSPTAEPDDAAGENGTAKELREAAICAELGPQMEPPESSPGPLLKAINATIDQALQGPTEEFKAVLASLKGKSFGSFEANQEIASVLQATADRLRVTFACAKCGTASRFKCYENAKVATGVFVFAHGKTTHGGTSSMPALKLAEKSTNLVDPS